jgi:H+/Cl- antiporter ClcA
MLNNEIEMMRKHSGLKLNDASSVDIGDSTNRSRRMSIDYLERSTGENIFQTISKYITMTNPREWLFILLFSSVVTCKKIFNLVILFIMDIAIMYGIQLRADLCSLSTPFVNFILWVISAVLLLLMATSVGRFISPEADGSGIPEVKTVLSGIAIYRYFSVEAFIAKCIGLIAAISGGKLNIYLVQVLL